MIAICPVCNRGPREVNNRQYGVYCGSCYNRWVKDGRPETGPEPPYRSWNRSTCGTGSGYYWHLRHGEDPCEDCQIGRRKYNAEEVERLDRLRHIWTLTHPGAKENPYACTLPECNETAARGSNGYCAKHFMRLHKTGLLDRPSCKHCGGKIDRPAGWSRTKLCTKCYRDWRYCSYIEHKGDRVMPISQMSQGGLCRECRKHYRQGEVTKECGHPRRGDDKPCRRLIPESQETCWWHSDKSPKVSR